MRNFFKPTASTNSNIKTKKQLAELLDTDEDNVINQYKRYLKYITRVKNELLQLTEDIINYNRPLRPSR